MAKPFLKWLGGKTQILEDVMNLFPTHITGNYYEPFLGGGSVLLALLTDITNGTRVIEGNVYASDINPILIALYKHIQNNVEEFIQEMTKLTSVYERLTGNVPIHKPITIQEALTSQESYYYWIREQFNSLPDKTTLEASAMMLFLNKTCFRGVYRENKKSKFNVPFGHYENLVILDAQNLREVSELLQPVIFTCESFEQAIQKITTGDFVYFDPPYVGVQTTSFDSYVAAGFSDASHDILFAFCHKLHEKNIHFVLSNAYVQYVLDKFPETKFHIHKINIKRAIHNKNPGIIASELLITNE